MKLVPIKVSIVKDRKDSPNTDTIEFLFHQDDIVLFSAKPRQFQCQVNTNFFDYMATQGTRISRLFRITAKPSVCLII